MRFGWLASSVAAALIVLSGSARADDPVKLRFVTLSAAESTLNKRLLHPWADKVNADGKGIVELDTRDGFALANYDNVYTRVMDNVVQVAFTLIGTITGKFQLANLVSLPLLFDKSDEASVAFWRLYKSGALDTEFSETVPLYMVALANSGFHLAKAPDKPAEITGLKIIASSKNTAQIVSALGGAPISLQQTDIYESLQRHTVDGSYGAWTSFPAFKLGEVTSYHIDAPLGSAPAMVFMSKKTFEGLNANVRKVLMDNSGEAQSRRFGAYWQDLDNEVRGQYKGIAGHTIVEPTAQQLGDWKAKLTPITAEWEKSSPNAAKILTSYRALIADVKEGK
jgi:TRAP-type C4-dicarboxylate transport system substrate-binding protein